MEGVMGLLKLRVKRGINLGDTKSIDPYIIATLDNQKTKTKVIKGNHNPVWYDELTLVIRDPEAPIHIAVYDEDSFSKDDNMGDAEIDLKPYIECLRTSLNMNMNDVANGTRLDCVHPTKNNCLANESYIVCDNGRVVQDMVLRLRNVECGEVEVQIELVVVSDSTLHV